MLKVPLPPLLLHCCLFHDVVILDENGMENRSGMFIREDVRNTLISQLPFPELLSLSYILILLP